MTNEELCNIYKAGVEATDNTEAERSWPAVTTIEGHAVVYIQLANSQFYSLILSPIKSEFDDILDEQIAKIANGE